MGNPPGNDPGLLLTLNFLPREGLVWCQYLLMGVEGNREQRTLMLEGFHCYRKDLATECTQTAPESGKMDTTIQIQSWAWAWFWSLQGQNQGKAALRVLVVERKVVDFRTRPQKLADYLRILLPMCLQRNLGGKSEPTSLTATADNTLRWYKLMAFHKKRVWGWVKHCLTGRLLFKGRSVQKQMAHSTPEVCLVQVRRSKYVLNCCYY